MALKLRGRGRGQGLAVEGEGGLTPGVCHETELRLRARPGNLFFILDWNDYGIDDTGHPRRATARRTTGSRRTAGASPGRQGSDWEPVTRAVLEACAGRQPARPVVAWFKTRKGRGYGKYDNKSHGSPTR